MTALGALAGNAGNYRTMQEDQQMRLQQEAADLHRLQVEDQIRSSGERDQLNAIQNVMLDQRQREINQANLAGRYGVADLNGQYGVQRAQAQQEGANDRTAATIAGQNERAGASNDVRIRINNQNDATRQRGIDSTSGIAYDRMAAQAQRDADRAEEHRALESFKTLEQQRRRTAEGDVSTQQKVVAAQIRELTTLRKINEMRARDPQSTPEERQAAAARIGPLNDEVQKRIQAIGSTSPRPSPGVPGQPPTPYDAQQPGMAQPAPSMNNMMQQGQVSNPGPVGMASPPPPILITPDGRRFRVAGHDGQQPVYEAVA